MVVILVDPIVVVRGDAQRFVQPDEATLDWFTSVAGRGQTQVLDEVAARLARAKDHLAGLRTVVRTSDWVRVGPRVRWAKGRSVPDGFEANAGLSLTVNDVGGLAELVTALSALDEVTVAGPTWSVRPGNAAYAEVRRAAIRDAQRMAADYAAAFGVSVTGLLEISDQVGSGSVAFAAMTARRIDSAEAVALDLTPAEQAVSASVLLRFTIDQPSRSALTPATPGG